MNQWLHYLANPTRMGRVLRWLLPWVVGLVLVNVPVFFYFALVASPPDYQQGETVRIMYIHVPAAYMGVMVFAVMAVMGFFYLVWRHEMAMVCIQALLPIGWVFTTLCLISGSLWGKPIWGTYWVWDARLTSVFILWLLYMVIFVLGRAFDNLEMAKRPVAIMCLVGAINLPIIKFSVEWWNSLHQPASLLRAGGPAMPAEMLTPLLLGLLLASLLGLMVFIWRVLTILTNVGVGRGGGRI